MATSSILTDIRHIHPLHHEDSRLDTIDMVLTSRGAIEEEVINEDEDRKKDIERGEVTDGVDHADFWFFGFNLVSLSPTMQFLVLVTCTLSAYLVFGYVHVSGLPG